MMGVDQPRQHDMPCQIVNLITTGGVFFKLTCGTDFGNDITLDQNSRICSFATARIAGRMGWSVHSGQNINMCQQLSVHKRLSQLSCQSSARIS